MNHHTRALFIDTVWSYYAAHARRDLPWRQGIDDNDFPYKVLVSEIMLQQTQVPRVIEKFTDWMKTFPTLESVANASLADCLALWSGLGYNRRAKFLHESCRHIVNDFNGHIPTEIDALVALPGIGSNTAGAIVAYSFNTPTIFIETNIRTVYIHHFFDDTNDAIADTEILELIKETVSKDEPREWYWALMDYGTHVKKTKGNASRKSAHHKKQSKFEGSNRQIRGQVLKLLQGKKLSLTEIRKIIPDERLDSVLIALEKEELIKKTGVLYKICD